MSKKEAGYKVFLTLMIMFSFLPYSDFLTVDPFKDTDREVHDIVISDSVDDECLQEVPIYNSGLPSRQEEDPVLWIRSNVTHLTAKEGDSFDLTFNFTELTGNSVEVQYCYRTMEWLNGEVIYYMSYIDLPEGLIVEGEGSFEWRTELEITENLVHEAIKVGASRFLIDYSFLTPASQYGYVYYNVRIEVEMVYKYAMVVDEDIYEGISSNLDTYMSDVKGSINADLVTRTGKWDTPEELRSELKDLWENESITGAVLLGDMPFALWEYERDDGDEVFPIPIFYEDLDGSFKDNDSDGFYDRHYWGENDGPEIFISFIKPPRQPVNSSCLDPSTSGTPVGGGLNGKYYDDRIFSSLRLTQTDPSIDHLWKDDLPKSLLNSYFSIKWTGRIKAPEDSTYTIAPVVAGNYNITIDDEVLFHNMSHSQFRQWEFTRNVYLTKGWHDVEINYISDWLGSQAPGCLRLGWTSECLVTDYINEYLERNHEYRTGQWNNSERAYLFFDYGYGDKCNMMEPIWNMSIKPIYGNNVMGRGGHKDTDARTYLKDLSPGNEMVSVWSHAGSAYHHIGPESTNSSSKTAASVWDIRKEEGGVMTMIWGCHAGDFGRNIEWNVSKLSQNLAVNYAFNTKYGLTSLGCTRSFGTTFRETYYSLANRSYIGLGYHAYKDYSYDKYLKMSRYPDTWEDMWVDDEVIVGDPFLTADHRPIDLSMEIVGPCISKGEYFTNLVRVNVSAERAEEVRFSTDGETWTEWEPYNGSHLVRIYSPRGIKEVRTMVRNSFGTSYLPATSYFDFQPPEIEIAGFAIEGGKEHANSTLVSLDIDVANYLPGDLEMILSNEKEGGWTRWMSFNPSFEWNLSDGEGIREVHFMVRERFSRSTVSIMDSILIDKTGPEMTYELSGTQGSDQWYRSDVLVELGSTDEWTTDPEITYSVGNGDWEVYTYGFDVSGDGIHIVRFTSMDEAGNRAPITTLDLKIDTEAPSDLSLEINGGREKTNTTTLDLVLGGTDDLSGMGDVIFSFDGIEWLNWVPYSEIMKSIVPNVDGELTIHMKARDRAGNEIGEPVVDKILIDQSQPFVVAIVPGDGFNSVETDTDITVEFSEPMDPDTVLVKLTCGNETIPLELVEVDDEQKFFTFVPMFPLEFDSEYLFEVDADARDLAGNTLHYISINICSFRTREALRPGAPTGLAGHHSEYGVRLEWEAPLEEGDSSIQGYNIYRISGSDNERILIGSCVSEEYMDDNISSGKTYQYLVTAYNEYGVGGFSTKTTIILPDDEVDAGPDDNGDVIDDGTGRTDEEPEVQEEEEGKQNDKKNEGFPLPFLISLIILGIIMLGFLFILIRNRTRLPEEEVEEWEEE